MIYILEFFKGASLALMLFGALKYNSFFYLCLGIIPGLLLSLIFVLLIENHKLKNENKLR
ncbi:membrane protein [Campylobacter jejuni]|nr:membrane protein [Campylobacter jejuni]